MTALPRDLQKPRQQRLAEVMSHLQLQAGQANSQMVVFGCTVQPNGGNAHTYDITAGEYVLGQSLIEFAGVSAQAVPAGAALSAGQNVIVLLEADASGTVTATTGVITTGTAVKPSPNASRIVLGYLTLSGAFVVGTTNLTSGMCVTTPYSAGNQSPTGGF